MILFVLEMEPLYWPWLPLVQMLMLLRKKHKLLARVVMMGSSRHGSAKRLHDFAGQAASMNAYDCCSDEAIATLCSSLELNQTRFLPMQGVFKLLIYLSVITHDAF